MVDCNVTPEMIDQIMAKYHLSFTSRLASIPTAIDSSVAGDGGTLSDLTEANIYPADEITLAPSPPATQSPMFAEAYLRLTSPPPHTTVAMEFESRSPEVVQPPPLPDFHSAQSLVELPQVQDAAAASIPTMMDMASETSQLGHQSEALTAPEQCAAAAITMEKGAANETSLQHTFLVSCSFVSPTV